jgi:DUF1365 family protein
VHAFERELLLALVDVEEIDAAPGGVLSLVRGLPITMRSRDHLPGASPRLADRVRELVRPALGREPQGPIMLLSQPRAFGLTFDPVSFVYCLREGSAEDPFSIEAVVAEVTNTPWGERHPYVLTEGVRDESGIDRFRADKTLHVSPFFEMDHTYEFGFSAEVESTSASITNRHAGEIVFEAGLALERVSGFDRPEWSVLRRHPWMPAETLVGIYVQAARLALKRVPFHAHPRKGGTRTLGAHASAETRGRR